MVERAKSLTAQVFDALLNDIVSGRRSSGTMLSENAVALEFGTSKTPVREAFVQLQALGLVEVLPQRGCLVFQPTAAEVRSLCEVRHILESAAVELAMSRAPDVLLAELHRRFDRMKARTERKRKTTFADEDAAFHQAIFEHSGNPSLLEAHRLFAPRLQALRTNLQSMHGYLLCEAQEDHAEMIRHLETGDVEGAKAAIGVHVRRMANRYETESALLSFGT